jgi:starch synthase
MSADIINTVSEQYCEEILQKNFGQDLDRILKNREDRLFGIVNGIDYKDYNPSLDAGLYKHYDYRTVKRKKLNKKQLQKELGLPENMDTPLLCLTSRVTFQKGFELITELLDPLARLDIQIVIMGDGDKQYISGVKKQSEAHPKKIKWLPFLENQNLETMLYAAADIFLLPSHHEPCGINQLIAMRYGCIPVVRKVGGLNDTVEDFNLESRSGTGICFRGFDVFSLYAAIQRALDLYQYRKIWRSLMVQAMRKSSSWEIPAKKYVALFRKAIRTNND